MAVTGYSVAAEYGGYFNRFVGLSFTAGMRRNAIDLYEYNRHTPGPVFYALHKWRTNYFILNALLQYPVNPDFAFYAKGGPGLTGNTLPGIVSSTATVVPDYQKVKAEALAYGFGGGFNWYGEGKILGMEAYSLHTSPVFQGNGITARQDMHSINFSVNLGFRFK